MFPLQLMYYLGALFHVGDGCGRKVSSGSKIRPLPRSHFSDLNERHFGGAGK